MAFPRNASTFSAYSASRTDVPHPMESATLTVDRISKYENLTKNKKNLTSSIKFSEIEIMLFKLIPTSYSSKKSQLLGSPTYVNF